MLPEEDTDSDVSELEEERQLALEGSPLLMGTEACQTFSLVLKSRKPRKRLDRQERDDIRKDNNEQERATIDQTLVQFLQRLVADTIGSQGTRSHSASEDHKVRETGVLTQMNF
jgi:alpha-acetolactate decarboxylase